MNELTYGWDKKTLANIRSSGGLSVLVSVNTVLLEVLCEFVYSGDIAYTCIVPAGQLPD